MTLVQVRGAHRTDYLDVIRLELIDAVHDRALQAVVKQLGRSPGRDVVAWLDALQAEAELIYGADMLFNDPHHHRVQLEHAVIAEWVTLELTRGPRRPNGLRYAFKRRFPESDREDWAFAVEMADRLGFVQGEFWRLPEEHPWHGEEHRDLPR